MDVGLLNVCYMFMLVTMGHLGGISTDHGPSDAIWKLSGRPVRNLSLTGTVWLGCGDSHDFIERGATHPSSSANSCIC